MQVDLEKKLDSITKHINNVEKALKDFNGKIKSLDANTALLNEVVGELTKFKSVLKQRVMDDFTAYSSQFLDSAKERRDIASRVTSLSSKIDELSELVKKMPCYTGIAGTRDGDEKR